MAFLPSSGDADVAPFLFASDPDEIDNATICEVRVRAIVRDVIEYVGNNYSNYENNEEHDVAGYRVKLSHTRWLIDDRIQVVNVDRGTSFRIVFQPCAT